MDARSALFDVYGDHLRERTGDDRGRAPVAALLRLLAPLGIQAPAVRTAVSRMARQGWLDAVRLDSGPGYALTRRAVQRLDDAAVRIYRRPTAPWDGRWHLVVVGSPPRRADRERLHTQLRWLGYGCLAPGTWVAPRPAAGVADVVEEAGVCVQRFSARSHDDCADVVSRAWDLDELAGGYRRFLDDARSALAGACTCTDEGAFAARSRLIHAWRAFLPLDPGLPPALLPAHWPGTTAAGWFDEQAARLLPAARRYVDHCLALHPVPALEGPLPCPRPSATEPSHSTSWTASPRSSCPARRG